MNEHEPPQDDNHAFAELSRIVLGEQPLSEILDRVVHLAKHVLPIPVEASLTVIAGDKPATLAHTGDIAIALDERQYDADRGPCLDAAASAHRILIADMTAETRWPTFTQAATEHGVHSSLSVPLPVQRDVTGALNFYATHSDAFDDHTIALAETFAGHAAVAVANAHLYDATAQLAAQMREAMTTRAVIEQAKGIIMRDRACSADDAFDALVQLSQQAHLKLRAVAQQLVDEVTRTGAATSRPD